MCLLNKYSLDILSDIKKSEKDIDGYYVWKQFINIYNLDEQITYTDILYNNSADNVCTKIAYGFKSLLESGFITNFPTLYPGSVNVNSLDTFKLTSLGILLLNYID